MSDDVFGFLARVSDATVRLARRTSFARPLRIALAQDEAWIDGLHFVRRDDIQIPPDMVSTGRHTVVYELLDGSGKTYDVTFAPRPETHR